MNILEVLKLNPASLRKGIINIIMDTATTMRRFVNLATNNRTQSFFRKKLCKYPAKSSVNFGQPCLCLRELSNLVKNDLIDH